jgi:hypothetical protein
MDFEKEIGEHKGFLYRTDMVMKKADSGKWHVKQTVHQSYSDDLENWEETSESFEARGFDLATTLAEVVVLTTMYLEAVNYNLFSENKVELKEGEYLQ